MSPSNIGEHHDGCPHYQNAEITALDDVLGDVELTVLRKCEICRVLDQGILQVGVEDIQPEDRGDECQLGEHFIDLYYRLYSLV